MEGSNGNRGKLASRCRHSMLGNSAARLLPKHSHLLAGVAVVIRSFGGCKVSRLSNDRPGEGSYLVDPASSHMLVSKIKPCMSKYKLLYTVKLRMAH